MFMMTKAVFGAGRNRFDPHLAYETLNSLAVETLRHHSFFYCLIVCSKRLTAVVFVKPWKTWAIKILPIYILQMLS